VGFDTKIFVLTQNRTKDMATFVKFDPQNTWPQITMAKRGQIMITLFLKLPQMTSKCNKKLIKVAFFLVNLFVNLLKYKVLKKF